MFNLILNVTFLLHLSQLTESLYSGENCNADDQQGICIPLSSCKPIDEAVRKAGNPMPPYMKNKLQSLTCGFEFNDPLVCCVSLETNPTAPDGETQVQTVIIPNKPTTTDETAGSEQNHNDNVEAYTRRGEDDNESRNIEGHPNLRLLPEECGNIEGDRIYGGNITQLFEMPWMVLISYRSARGIKYSCGGTIINKWYIMTAAHCVSFLQRVQLNSVILGEHDITQDPDCVISDGKPLCAPSVIDATIDTIVAHPGYTPETLTDDIALIRLAKPADFSSVSLKPVCLPITRQLQTQSLVGAVGVAAGWGATENTLPSPVLLSVELPIVSPTDCQNVYNKTIGIGAGHLCAGGVKDKDSCSGDSGGPLMVPGKVGKAGVSYVQRGIISFGPRQCSLGKFPGVYTNVAYYMNWILDNIRN